MSVYNGGIRFAPDVYYEIKEMNDSDFHVLRNGIEVSGGGDAWGSVLRQLNDGTLINLVVPDDIIEIGIACPIFSKSNITSVEMPNVTSIGEGVFAGCESLTSVEMPNVTSIGNLAFSWCHLTSVEMPDVTSIGESAFESCASLTSVEMPNVTSIGNNAFQGCESLTSVEMPNVTSIGDFAFYECFYLNEVVIDNTNPPILGSMAFDDTRSDLKIYVPASAVDTYKAAAGWSDYADKITAIGS